MICFRYITVNSLHEGGGDDDDDNNNGKIQKRNLCSMSVRQRDTIVLTCIREGEMLHLNTPSTSKILQRRN
jgi:hypothetical protein